ncbi:hypothetical protein [Ornithinimicrobium cavernae]|uniref:hypothetical protein n=1 Tax=Ornithinimicrobium cavernae TaxID=2666047 RepID=UPI000D690AF2|nr:hypothetical protein [Ornithinimicrobium cavernae]
MITDEHDLARSLHAVQSPPGLRLDPDDVLGAVHRADRRRRARTGALTTGSLAAVTVAALWATGSTVGPIGILPAAPWAQACSGIVDGPDGTRIELDRVSYAELPLSGSATGSSVVVAVDRCGGDGARVAYATRDAQGRLGEVEGWNEPGEETLEALREGRTVTPQPNRTPEGEVLIGVIASGATEVQVLSVAGPVDVQRQPLPDTGLDAYVSTEFSDPETETLGMTWRSRAGVEVVWLQVLDTADFDAPGTATEPLIAQDRNGLWRIWFGDEQGVLEGLLGTWLGVEFVEGEGRQVVAYLPSADHRIEVTTPDGGEAVGAEIRYAEPSVAAGRFAWVSAPSGSEISWVDGEGTREELTEPVRPRRDGS